MNNNHEGLDTGSTERAHSSDSDISRRTWITTIGQAAIAASFPNGLRADPKTLPQLPPGVYLPSTDHLGHALMSGGRFHTIPAGCPTDYIRPSTEPFAPQFFSGTEFAVLRRLIELMLDGGAGPATNPGATPVEEIAEWVDLQIASAPGIRQAVRSMDPLHRAVSDAYSGPARLRRLETATPENTCREGLSWLAHAAQLHGANQFLSLSEDQQIAVLESISDGRIDKQNENSGTRFFAFLKSEVIRAFYTSQMGLKEIDFKGNAFYARSPGCEHKDHQSAQI